MKTDNWIIAFHLRTSIDNWIISFSSSTENRRLNRRRRDTRHRRDEVKGLKKRLSHFSGNYSVREETRFVNIYPGRNSRVSRNYRRNPDAKYYIQITIVACKWHRFNVPKNWNGLFALTNCSPVRFRNLKSALKIGRLVLHEKLRELVELF